MNVRAKARPVSGEIMADAANPAGARQVESIDVLAMNGRLTRYFLGTMKACLRQANAFPSPVVFLPLWAA
ncbi:hypothetical protein L598_000700001440 [Mesorhizobium sp. J18]|uniref:hypothetical protein n=1 Tax=Mesorhizobium sp. J18 TaxID=935263 RepID=UPI00119C89EF|nr:hypothetical protein [Mesorhizobium sp. J18]TWG90387.1 hypothetical protein L598_000700001440 [Mesorhizobium sp. J18]